MNAAAPPRSPRRQHGATAVEFAIVAAIFLMLLIGAMEMGRLLWTWNAAAEATRLGARLAVVCDQGDADIVARMQRMLPGLPAGNVSISYVPSGCTVANCQAVTVSIVGYQHSPVIPFVPMTLDLPTFLTRLPRESMSSAGNPVCTAA
jgi:Flp pilus assembly pilin Flp